MNFYLKPCLLLFILCLSQTALAWNAAGHRQIAALAWDLMEEPVRQEALFLLKKHPDYPRWLKQQREQDPDYGVFLEASVWADDIRRDQRFYSPGERQTPLFPGFPDMARHSDWHYQDESSGKLAERLPQLAKIVAEQRQGDEERAYALVWLLHLVGDLHQPLHTRGRNDKGGNLFLVKLPRKSAASGKERWQVSLHSYWDDLPGPSWLRGERLRATLPGLQHPPGGKTGDVKRWLAESRALVRHKVYPSAPGEISPEFHKRAKAISRQRIALAGYRLGMWLNLLLTTGLA